MRRERELGSPDTPKPVLYLDRVLLGMDMTHTLTNKIEHAKIIFISMLRCQNTDVYPYPCNIERNWKFESRSFPLKNLL